MAHLPLMCSGQRKMSTMQVAVHLLREESRRTSSKQPAGAGGVRAEGRAGAALGARGRARRGAGAAGTWPGCCPPVRAAGPRAATSARPDCGGPPTPAGRRGRTAPAGPPGSPWAPAPPARPQALLLQALMEHYPCLQRQQRTTSLWAHMFKCHKQARKRACLPTCLVGQETLLT